MLSRGLVPRPEIFASHRRQITNLAHGGCLGSSAPHLPVLSRRKCRHKLLLLHPHDFFERYRRLQVRLQWSRIRRQLRLPSAGLSAPHQHRFRAVPPRRPGRPPASPAGRRGPAGDSDD